MFLCKQTLLKLEGIKNIILTNVKYEENEI